MEAFGQADKIAQGPTSAEPPLHLPGVKNFAVMRCALQIDPPSDWESYIHRSGVSLELIGPSFLLLLHLLSHSCFFFFKTTLSGHFCFAPQRTGRAGRLGTCVMCVTRKMEYMVSKTEVFSVFLCLGQLATAWVVVCK